MGKEEEEAMEEEEGEEKRKKMRRGRKRRKKRMRRSMRIMASLLGTGTRRDMDPETSYSTSIFISLLSLHL